MVFSLCPSSTSSPVSFRTAFLTHVSSVLITFVTLAVFLTIENGDIATDESAKFTTGRVFAALALFNQLTVPLFIFPLTVPIIISAIVSTKRLKLFLELPEVQKEFEGIRNMARVMSRSDASLDVFEIEDNESQSEILDDVTVPTEQEPNTSGNDRNIESTNYQNDDVFINSLTSEKIQVFYKRPTNASTKLKKNNQLSMNAKLERSRSRQKSLTKEVQMEISSDLIVSIRNGIFSWSAGKTEANLKIDNLEIPKGKSIL